MMISFYRKITPHSFLGLTSPLTTPTTSLDTAAPHDQNLPFKCHSPLATAGGGGLLGLFTPPNIIKHQTLVLESSSIKASSSASTSIASSSDSSSPPSSSPPTGVFETKKGYPAGFGFIDEIGGGVDGLMSCTESLGFESSDERLVDDHHHHHHVVERFSYDEDHDVVEEKEDDAYLRLMKQPIKRQPSTVKKMAEAKKFPPLLSSLNQNGKPKYYLRPIRKDGRLELTEVRIYRPEILRAYREDGRLRLHLISQRDQPLQEEEEEEEELEAIEELQEEEEEEEEIVEEENETRVKETEEEKEQEENVGGGEWKLQVGGEGFRRCQNLVNRHHVHHHHNSKLAVWNHQQHCVTSR